jgi:hypothetical protein
MRQPRLRSAGRSLRAWRSPCPSLLQIRSALRALAGPGWLKAITSAPRDRAGAPFRASYLDARATAFTASTVAFAVDFFTVPTVTFDILHVFVVLSPEGRRPAAYVAAQRTLLALANTAISRGLSGRFGANSSTTSWCLANGTCYEASATACATTTRTAPT